MNIFSIFSEVTLNAYTNIGERIQRITIQTQWLLHRVARVEHIRNSNVVIV